MTDLRKAAQQALEALEYYEHRQIEWDYADQATIAALRAALEQQEQPKQDKHITDGSLCWCGPELVYVDPENGAKVWVHKEPT